MRACSLIFLSFLLSFLALGIAGGPGGAAAQSAVPEDCREGPRAPYAGTTVVHFDTGSTTVGGKDALALERLAERMAGNPGVWWCLLGQADKQGDAEANRRLSLKRAEAVGDFLAARGIPKAQMLYGWRGEAFGGANPLGLFGEDEEEGEQKDRRVEVFLVPN